jgi:DNA-binding phage protein
MGRKRLEILPADGRRIYAKLAADVSRALYLALQTEKQERNMTKANVARLIGRNKATVTRALSGGNLELRTIAAILAALGHEFEVSAHRIEAPRHLKKNHVHPDQTEPTSYEIKARVLNGNETTEASRPVPNQHVALVS